MHRLGALEEGAAFLRPYLRDHDPFEGVNVHTAWHLAYIELELGRPAEALDWHRRVVAPTLSPMTYSSAVSLIWRMEVAGYGGPHLRPDWELLHAFDPGPEATSHLDEIARAMTWPRLRRRPWPGRRPGAPACRCPARRRGRGGRAAPHRGPPGLLGGRLRRGRGRLEALAPSLGRLSEFPDQLGVFQETQRRARTLAGV